MPEVPVTRPVPTRRARPGRRLLAGLAVLLGALALALAGAGSAAAGTATGVAADVVAVVTDDPDRDSTNTYGDEPGGPHQDSGGGQLGGLTPGRAIAIGVVLAVTAAVVTTIAVRSRNRARRSQGGGA